jgi:nitroimidazol reductase NimA-like FMN-containing flavoprotein (pyridoxamine 5'-phosphate oxidase superfamily)
MTARGLDATDEDRAAAARAILDDGRYMTLATADAEGRPWATPVWYAPDGYSQLYWVSSPDARHSRNIAARPEVGIVVFDSGATPNQGQAVYMTATAGEAGDAIETFARRSAAQGLPPWTADDVLPPARLRLYKATVTAHFVLGHRDERVPVTLT